MSLFDQLKKSSQPSVDFPELLANRAIGLRVLKDCVFELTPFCNFSCPFCYARLSREDLSQQGLTLLTVTEWKSCIDQLCELGIMGLTLTGGECTLHPDFAEIYEYAYQKGLMLTVLTNGSAMTDELLALFYRCPPSRIYITLYGASPEGYQTTCGNSNFFNIVRNNTEALVRAGHQVVAQFTAGQTNTAELSAIYQYTQELGIPLRINNDLIQFGKCTGEVLESNTVSEALLHAAEKEMQATCDTPENAGADDNAEFFPKFITSPPEKGVPCNAGRSSCFIKWDGFLYPCVSWDAFKMDIRSNSLAECWKALVAWADEVPCLTQCTNCLHKIHCKACLAVHYNDTKQFGKPSDRLCWKCTHPERAAETEAFYQAHGYLRKRDIEP